MLPTQRRRAILAELRQTQAVSAEDLAQRFGVSAETIRRDHHGGRAFVLAGGGRRILPGLAFEKVTATYAGLRAVDYVISVDGRRRYACVAGIRSTGLSASLGIAEHVADLLGEAGLPLRPRPVGPPPRMAYLGEAGPRPYQDAAAIAADPAYGENRVPLRAGDPGERSGTLWPAWCRRPTSAGCAAGPAP
jgi:DeoR-like helix-turn-helix domain